MTSTDTAGAGTARQPGRDRATVRERLDQAADGLTAANGALAARVPEPADLLAAVEGAIRLSNALAGLVTTVIRQAPASLGRGRRPDTGPILDELLADLRAMHGCLMTGPLLLAPARDDLSRLVNDPLVNPEGGPTVADDAVPARDVPVREAAEHDVADQRRPARVATDGYDEDQDLDGVGEVLEADPADVVDQHRDAPVLDETEPWP